MWEPIDEELIPLPEGLLCPICQDLFTQPVATVDGHSYCSACITAWFDEFDRKSHERKRMGHHLDIRGQEIPLLLLAPLTNLPLPSRSLRPNVALRQAVEAYRQNRPLLEKREKERQSLRKRFHELQERHAFLLGEEDKTELVAELYRLKMQSKQLAEQVCAANTELLRMRECAAQATTRADAAERDAAYWRQRAETLEKERGQTWDQSAGAPTQVFDREAVAAGHASPDPYLRYHSSTAPRAKALARCYAGRGSTLAADDHPSIALGQIPLLPTTRALTSAPVLLPPTALALASHEDHQP